MPTPNPLDPPVAATPAAPVIERPPHLEIPNYPEPAPHYTRADAQPEAPDNLPEPGAPANIWAKLKA